MLPLGLKVTGLFLSLGIVLAGCASQDLDNSSEVSAVEAAESDQSEKVTDKKTKSIQVSDASFCPELEILEGTGTLTAYLSGGKDTKADISHQATFTKSGRKCTEAGGKLRIRVGAAGRVMKGPKAVGDAIDLPIRIAILSGKDKVLFTKLYQQSVVFTGSSAQAFSFTREDVSIPIPDGKDVKVLVGFDTKSG